MDICEKVKCLENYIESYSDKDIVIAFSGGVDSSLLLKIACTILINKGCKVYAVMAKTMLHPFGDEEIARNIADEFGAVFKVVEINELNEAGISNNPIDRCYRCKKYIFSKITEIASEMGTDVIFDGTNEDDLHVYRPGLKVLKEGGIISPLAECKITKSDVREMAAMFSISVANRPSTPCLATRLPYGTKISYELLEKIDICENYIRSLGFKNVRLRIHNDICRIEIDEEQFELFFKYRDDISDYLKRLAVTYITLDINGFMSGSMDKHLQNIQNEK